MELWTFDPDDPDDEPVGDEYGWFGALIEFARKAREDDQIWPVFVDEFDFMAGVTRRPRPDIWIYRHRETRGYLHLDRTGQAYRFIPYEKGPQRGRFVPIGFTRAIWGARLPDACEVTYLRRPESPPEFDDWYDEELDSRGRRGHLHLA